MRKLKIHSILIVIIILKQVSFALSLNIAGAIKDKTHKQELPGASIILFEKKNNKLCKTTISDEKGSFQLSNIMPNTYLVRIQYIGYQEYVIDSLVIYQDTQLEDIFLIPLEQNLSEVNVTAVKSNIDQSATTTIVNVSESSLATGGTAYDMLQKIPGISTTDDNISTRGKTLSLLLNGRLINIPAEEMIAILKSLPASSIEKIEINNNPTGKYDGQVQAILDIKTLKPKNDTWGGTITLGAGMGRRIKNNSNINLFYKKNRLSSCIGWDYIDVPTLNHYRKAFPYSQSIFNDYRHDAIDSQTHTLQLDMDYTFHPHHSIGIFIQPVFNPMKLFSVGTTTIENKNTNLIDSINYYTNLTNFNFKELVSTLHYQTDFDTIKNKELAINIDYYRYNKNQIGTYFIDVLPNTSTEKKETQPKQNENPTEINIRSATIDYTHHTLLGKWQTGLKSSWITVDNYSIWRKYDGNNWIVYPFFSDRYLYTENVYAAYAGFSGNFKKVNLNLFLRAEQTYSTGTSILLNEPTNRNYLNFFPTLNLEYTPSTNHQWIFSYRKSIQRPSYKNLNPFLFMRTPNFYQQGNPFLLPQFDHNWEITYTYHQQVFVKILYQKRDRFIRGLYQELDSIQGLVGKMENYTSYSKWMVNLSINKSVLSYWHLTGDIGISYIKQTYSGIQIGVSSPGIFIAFSSTINLSNNWNLELSGRFISPFSDGTYRDMVSYSLSTGIKKSFLQNKLSLALLLSGDLPYWSTQTTLYMDAISSYNPDSRFFILSINYKIGNTKKDITAKKSKIDAEKNRVQ